MTTRTKAERCSPETRAVNAVLATIAPGWSLGTEESAGKPRPVFRLGDATLPVKLRASDRLWLAGNGRPLRHWGGTVEQAVCQLVLWWRDLPRRPLGWWRHVTSSLVGVGTPETLRLLADDEPGGYADPRRVGCVLCGAADPSDWWALGKVIGPCCFGGMCQRKDRETTA